MTMVIPRRIRESLRVFLKMSVSLPTSPVAAHATAIDWGEISLPITPPKRFADVVKIGFMPRCPAVTCCSFPNKAAEDVTDPVKNTPSHPITGEKTGKTMPVDTAKAKPSVNDIPE